MFYEGRGKKIVASASTSPIQRIKFFARQQVDSYQKKASVRTIKRILKDANFVWKRMRKSLKKNRDEVLFRFFQGEMELLKQQASQGKIDLYYFDGTGVSLNPNVPYCWTKKGETFLLPATRGGGYTILGLLNIHENKFQGNIYEGAANAECVIQTLEELSKNLKRKTVIVLDNASIHKANIVREKMESWRSKGMLFQFIPAYSPELNLIEILWKIMKHFWIEPKHYTSLEVLNKAIIHILQNYGKAYSISFD